MRLIQVLALSLLAICARGQGFPPIQVATPVPTPQIQALPKIDLGVTRGIDPTSIPRPEPAEVPKAAVAARPAAKVAYMEAARPTVMAPIDAQLDYWRSDAADAIHCAQLNGFQIFVEALGVMLSYDPKLAIQSNFEAGTDVEALSLKARECTTRYLNDLKEIEYFSGAQDEADRRYAERIQHLRIDRTGSYAVNVSQTTAHYSTYEPSSGTAATEKKCHDETEYKIEKVPVKAGFRNGEPYYDMRWDVVPHQRQVCD